MADITQDLFERDVILSDLKRILEISSSDEDQFRARTKDLSKYEHKFTKLQCKIEKFLIKTDIFRKDEQLDIRNNFNDLYYSVMSIYNKLKKDDDEVRRGKKRFELSLNKPSDIPSVDILIQFLQKELSAFENSNIVQHKVNNHQHGGSLQTRDRAGAATARRVYAANVDTSSLPSMSAIL
ncbi:hypothetical protein ACJJTC_017557 [Scirpophaga incertulas]